MKTEPEIVTITADIAKDWLKHNTKNRKLSPTVVERYRRDMEAGRWVYAADPIRFAANGRLLDGQHRLAALAQLPSAAITVLVVRGLQDEAQLVMDQGNKRTAGAQLSLHGVKNPNEVAAGAKVYIMWRDGLLFRDSKRSGLITAPQIAGWVEEHKELIEFVSSHATILRHAEAPPSVKWGAAFRFAQISEAHTEEFFRSLAQGGRPLNHPINTLDKRLQRIRREGLKISPRDHLGLFVQAWNAWREGREMSKFQRPRGGSWTAENFPQPK